MTHVSLVDTATNRVLARHDGYARLEDPVIHTQAVTLVNERTALVYDHLDALGAHRYSCRWPTVPRTSIARVDGMNGARISIDGVDLTMGVYATGGEVDVRVAQARSHPSRVGGPSDWSRSRQPPFSRWTSRPLARLRF